MPLGETRNTIRCLLQKEDFDLAEEYQHLRNMHPNAGAIVTFSGLVREFSPAGKNLKGIELDTYPELAKQQLMELAQVAMSRFDIEGLTIIHRYGMLTPTEQIVFVGVASLHRAESFQAAEMLMDHLKANVAFWKKEHFTPNQDTKQNAAKSNDYKWINTKPSDQEALKRWD